MNVTAIVENDMIKLPVHVPDGTKAEITLKTEEQAPPIGEAGEVTDALLAISTQVKGLPSDLAAQHDHYLHGHPKR